MDSSPPVVTAAVSPLQFLFNGAQLLTEHSTKQLGRPHGHESVAAIVARRAYNALWRGLVGPMLGMGSASLSLRASGEPPV